MRSNTSRSIASASTAGEVYSTVRPEGEKKRTVLERVEHRLTGQRELVERLARDHAGAMHWLTARRVLLEEHHVEIRRRQQLGDVQASGTAANDRYVMHG